MLLTTTSIYVVYIYIEEGCDNCCHPELLLLPKFKFWMSPCVNLAQTLHTKQAQACAYKKISGFKTVKPC